VNPHPLVSEPSGLQKFSHSTGLAADYHAPKWRLDVPAIHRLCCFYYEEYRDKEHKEEAHLIRLGFFPALMILTLYDGVPFYWFRHKAHKQHRQEYLLSISDRQYAPTMAPGYSKNHPANLPRFLR